MVREKYSWLAPLARLSPLCPYSGPAVLHEVGEVVYSQAENKTNISTCPGPPCSKARSTCCPMVACPASNQLLLSHIPVNQSKTKTKIDRNALAQVLPNNWALQISSFSKQKPLNSQHSACITTNITNRNNFRILRKIFSDVAWPPVSQKMFCWPLLVQKTLCCKNPKKKNLEPFELCVLCRKAMV